jgi:hypothetical protein
MEVLAVIENAKEPSALTFKTDGLSANRHAA